MALSELPDSAALQSFLTSNSNVVMTFSAHWCGPCKASKPQLEALAEKYAADVTKNVKFGIVYEDALGEGLHAYNIRAFPTYVLFQKGTETNRVEGVNMAGVESMIASAEGTMQMTGGQTLSDGAAALSPEEARAARLAKLGAGAPPPAPAPAPAPTPDVEMKEKDSKPEAKDDDGDTKMEDANAEPEMVDPTADLDPELIKTLTEGMGFPLIRAQKGLLNGNARTVEAAIDWLTNHQDDDDIDEPIPLQPKGGAVAQSYKCNECGKILSNMANLELHANKTGHSDFEESTQHVKPLTPEEKAKKIAEIKELLKLKRAEREEAEKVDDVQREKSRRLMGKEMAKTREQMEIEQRKRDAIARKKEKEAARRERERIRAELEKDRLERKARGGKLASKLGVDGYNPDAIQYDKDAEMEGENAGDSPGKKKSTASTAKIDEYIQKVSSYKAGGDGEKCLKILLVFVKNVVENPDEEKYKSINTEGKAYKTKVKPFLGAKALLMAVGFSPNDGGDKLVLKDDADADVLANTKAKLEKAIETY